MTKIPGIDSDRVYDIIINLRDDLQKREDRASEKIDELKTDITTIKAIVNNTSDRVQKLESNMQNINNKQVEHSTEIKILKNNNDLSLKTAAGWRKLTPYLILGFLAVIGWLQSNTDFLQP